MRKIGVCVSFLNTAYRSQIRQAADSLGFQAFFFDEARDQAAFVEQLEEFEVIFGHPAPSLLQKAKNLRWLCSDFAGVEKYLDGSLWPCPDCLLSNGSGAYGPAISEHIVMVLLMLLRRMPEYQHALAKRQWPCFGPIRSVIGSRVVMLGTGDIGSNTARRLQALGAHVTGVSRSGRAAEPAFEKVVPVSGLDSVLPDADALIMALPATPETVHILSRDRIALLSPSAFVVNVGRGAAVDQEALVEALQAQRLAGAALDVMTPEPLPADHPLWSCPNTIITPHISGNMTLGLTCSLDVDMFCRDLEHYAAGEPLEHLVDRARGVLSVEKLLESDLYGPVKGYLQGLGYEVRGEVKNCDLTAVRDDELIVVELKRGFTVDLLYQALDRQRIADSVYVAVPLPKRGYQAPHMQDMQTLCRRLELGLIFVAFSGRGRAQIYVAVHPKEAAAPRRDQNRRRAVIREHSGRRDSADIGGVTHRKILTAYKEKALLAARILRDSGPLLAEEVRKRGGPEDTASILGRNSIGWFSRRRKRGGRKYLYSVNEKGLAALEQYKDLLE